MTPKTGFSAALERAKHQLKLYELICDTRQRSIRSDWAASFRRTMRWPANEKIVRVDGSNSNSIMVFRESCGVSRKDFGHKYVSELLRNAVVASISALDRMLHDHVVKHSWKLLSYKEEQVPKKLGALGISALDVRKALEKLRRDNKSRPGNAIKSAIQERLHRDYTFQSPDGVLQAAQMLGINDFWGKVALEMPGHPEKG